MDSKKLRVLLLAPGSNPDSVTGPLIGYCHGEALSRLHRVTFVIDAKDHDAVCRATSSFDGIESVSLSLLDRCYDWMFRHIFKGDRGNLLWTAVRFPRAIAFELRAWKQLRTRIIRGEFDVVLRLLPIVPMFPSPFAYFLRKGPIPFVIGPLNGGVPWPTGFSQLSRQRAAAGNWAAKLRGLYRLLPFARSTFGKAAAIIGGASHTCREFARYEEKVFYVPGENGVFSSLIEDAGPKGKGRLKIVFAGRLVPYKACDIALRGAAALLRNERAHFSVVGDGPDRERLEALVDELEVRPQVAFCGWLEHEETLAKLKESDVLLFPSLREFGGGVVFEALAKGVVPVVANHGGPGDIVVDGVGYRIAVSDERQMVSQINSVLSLLDTDREYLAELSRRGIEYARRELTWEAKAKAVSRILSWAVEQGSKPQMNPPRNNSSPIRPLRAAALRATQS